jgi:WD40 repeat protein
VWVRFAPDGQGLLTGDYGGAFGAWDAATGRERQPLRDLAPGSPRGHLLKYFLSSDGRRLVHVTGNDRIETDPKPGEGRVFLGEPSGDPAPTPLAGQVGPAHSAALTPDNRFVVTTEAGGLVRVYEAASGRLARTFAGRRYEYHPTFTPDGTTLATTGGGAYPATVRLYDFATGQVLRDLRGPTNATGLAIAPDGHLLASGHMTSLDPQNPTPGDWLILWHIASGRELWRVPTEHLRADRLAFAPDGRLLVSGGMRGSVRLWEAASGQERRQFAGHEHSVSSVDFAPDGRRIASGSHDYTALIWRVFDPGPVDVSDAELAATWDDLAGDAATAHRALGVLLSARGSVAFLAKQLPPDKAVADERLAQPIGALDSPRFTTREQSEKELTRLADLAAPALRRALDGRPSAEVHQRAERLLKALDWPLTNAALLRKLRAVEALEHIGTPEARTLLAELANGDPAARLTREARASLERRR